MTKAIKLSAGEENYSVLLVKIQRKCWSQTVVLHLGASFSLAVTQVWWQYGSETCEVMLLRSVLWP